MNYRINLVGSQPIRLDFGVKGSKILGDLKRGGSKCALCPRRYILHSAGIAVNVERQTQLTGMSVGTANTGFAKNARGIKMLYNLLKGLYT